LHSRSQPSSRAAGCGSRFSTTYVVPGWSFLHAEATDVVSLLLDKALASSADVLVMTYPAETPVAS